MSRFIKNELAMKNPIRRLMQRFWLGEWYMDFITKYYDSWYGQYMFLDIIWKEIAVEISPKVKDSFIDVGCGTGGLLYYFHANRPDIPLTGVDLSKNSLDLARKKVADESVILRQSSSTQIPLSDNSFSNGVSTFSFVLWNRPIEMLNEIFRILKDGGEFIIYDFNGDEKYIDIIRKDFERVLNYKKTPFFIRKMLEIDSWCECNIVGLFDEQDVGDLVKRSLFSKYEIRTRSIFQSSEHTFLEVCLRK